MKMTSFKTVVKAFNKLEETPATLEKIDILKDLFREVESSELDKLIYLALGILYPNYMAEPPIGIAEKVAIKAIAKMSRLNTTKIENIINEKGGVGKAIGTIFEQKKEIKTLDNFFGSKTKEQEKIELQSIDLVYSTLDEIAHLKGKGSTLKKIDLLSNLLLKSTKGEAKYILRTILGTLRLGIAEMTIINGLSVAFTDSKDNKEFIEKKYNIFPDLGKIGKILSEKGLEGLKDINIRVGIPIKMMLGQRAKTFEDIFERMGNECACEYKYDGERVQAHKNKNKVILFSRNTEDITSMYPDLVSTIKKLPVDSLIIEGEIVAIDVETGRIKSFQELMKRRRKYDIDKFMKEYPVELYLFDILYLNEKNLLNEPYLKRRKTLEDIITTYNEKQDSILKLATQRVVNSKQELKEFFEDSLTECEGLMIKSVNKKSVYQAGNRGYLWLKLKKSYHSKMIDSVDLVIIGAYSGRGRRGGTYGAFLCAVYNKDEDKFQSICKVGSGIKDEDIERFPELFNNLEMDNIPMNVDTVAEKLVPDVWLQPKIVCSLIGDEITLSPDHRAGYNLKKESAGFAIRFPRFLGWREDKSISDITTVSEILDIYDKQTK
ncbi:MAG: ATP-dependent DNA ligase [Candidatus Lokiarchaeota archaeon]|nr:ATP-dependent DNA ligase [Candidatus Lokiarchaeota archaeon]